MSEARSIGVLTFHRCINYGSYWQACALVEGLRARGLNAALLDHRSDRVNRAEWRCALSPHLPARTRPEDRPAYARKTRRFFEAFEALPRSAPFVLEDPQAVHAYDTVLVGSDEVWNLRHPWYGQHRLFYGEGLGSPKLAAYAASFGAHPAEDGLDAGRTAELRRFRALSVRDDNSRRLVRDFLGCEPELVLDPCLQFPQVARRIAADGDYAVVYGHGFTASFKAGVRSWARANGKRLVSLGYYNDWADEQRLDDGPEAFAQAIAGAAGVATTFFHGCVFALLHDKPFVCAASDYGPTRCAR